MNSDRGIFESFHQTAAQPEPPFAASPPSSGGRCESPFTVIKDGTKSGPVEARSAVRIPELTKIEAPFQFAEPSEGFGFEAPPKAPLAIETQIPAQRPSPFSIPSRQPQPAEPTSAAPQGWLEPAGVAASKIPSVFTQPGVKPPLHVPSAFVEPAAIAGAPFAEESDSFAIKQLELRAIFRIDREMNAAEILERSGALPGIRHLARVSQQDMAGFHVLRDLLANLGFGTGDVKLYAGSAPIEFIREGAVSLAVQTDGGFAPGVRETLMLVARELARLP